MKCHVGALLWVTKLCVCNELMFRIKVLSLLLPCVKCIVSDPLHSSIGLVSCQILLSFLFFY